MHLGHVHVRNEQQIVDEVRPGDLVSPCGRVVQVGESLELVSGRQLRRDRTPSRLAQVLAGALQLLLTDRSGNQILVAAAKLGQAFPARFYLRPDAALLSLPLQRSPNRSAPAPGPA